MALEATRGTPSSCSSCSRQVYLHLHGFQDAWKNSFGMRRFP